MSEVSRSNPQPPQGKVAGVIVPCQGDRKDGTFVPTLVDTDDWIFRAGESCLVSQKIGLSLLVRPHPSQVSASIDRRTSSGASNQIVTFMMIEPDSGLADYKWQQDVGNMLFVRKDKKPLSCNQLEGLWQFHTKCIGLYGDEVPSKPPRMMTPDGWNGFWETYKEDKIKIEAGWQETRNPMEI